MGVKANARDVYKLAGELMETQLVNWFFVGSAGSRTVVFGLLLGTCPSNWRQPDRTILAVWSRV